jgi:hypothetical protein
MVFVVHPSAEQTSQVSDAELDPKGEQRVEKLASCEPGMPSESAAGCSAGEEAAVCVHLEVGEVEQRRQG